MQLIELLNQLDASGDLGKLYRSGVLNLKSYNYREVVGVYRALLTTPTYADQPSRAAEATAQQCRISVRSVYRAIDEMERTV